jgi:tetratricopeptide (TPR) repeat protein
LLLLLFFFRKSFVTLIQRIKKGKIAGQEVEFNEANKELKKSIVVDEEKNKPKLDDESHTESSSDKLDYFEIYKLLRERDYTAADKFFEKIEISEKKESERLKKRLTFYYQKYIYGFNKALVNIKSLEQKATDLEVKGHYYLILGQYYNHAKIFNQAIENLKKSLELESSTYKVEILWGALYSNGDKNEAYALLLDKLNSSNEDKEKSDFLNMLSEYFGKEDNSLMKAIALEKAIEFDPNNTDHLFGAAYNYSEAGLEHLTVNHYLNAIYFNNNDPFSLNNLGVSLSRLGLPFKSINYYKKAMKKKNTLAYSNLAYQFIEVGFEIEAEKILDEAIKIGDVHKNVWSAKDKLKSGLNSEDKKFEELKDKGLKNQSFIKDFANEFFTINSRSIKIEGEWVCDGIDIEVELVNEIHIIKWTDNEDLKNKISLKLQKQAGLVELDMVHSNQFLLSKNKNYSKGLFIIRSDEKIDFLFLDKKDSKYLTITKS